ncbi:MAG: transglycosylase domain-containing protein [Paracoccus sp. (in: a-proteobacteria)]|uniref:transglycosylase domain-containing protein n=1 Tax=Paracoccus sp. TaxID=267 RepID=UPI0026E000CD|nr:transglycosylase domain-containing protein [Paracoccus sp. (in: a-proteobacteria)]MDO5621797.1 transglycosylase domain-containing protein [Paracoccus sp. (in: a-proteobacteria)]
MKPRPGRWFALAGLIFSALSAGAQELPSRESIRADYQAASKDWRPVPEVVLQAFMVAQDRGFYRRSPSFSTLTREITRWYSPAHNQVPAASLPATMALGQALGHDEILNWFVNGVFLGQSCYGVQGAAGAYFGKDMTQLSLSEAALLASLSVAPADLNPRRNPEKALERRNYVLRNLLEDGVISQTAAATARAEPLTVLNPLGTCHAR